MNSILNTLKYGDNRTKRSLGTMLGIAGGALFCGLLGILLQNPVVAVIGAAVFLIDMIVLANTDFSKEKLTDKTPKQKKTGKKEKKEEQDKQEEEDTAGALDWMSEDKVMQRSKKEEPKVNPLLQYDEQKIKKLMVAYKVKKEHVAIMVDSCATERIQQCPAYAWKDATYLYFLFLEQEPKLLKCPLQDTSVIKVKVGVSAKPSNEYQNMKEKSLLGKLFSSYLPQYYRVETSGYKVDFRKNLYSVGKGVWCTAASMVNIFKILSAEVVLEESKINSDVYSIYFRDIYISRVLFRDAIITAQDYKKKVQDVLTTLSDADVSDEVFHSYLAQMVLGGLIPQEYADFAIAKRAQKKK